MMIELEIQGLSERREGLLVEVGRLVLASGFSLQRQRLVHDHHGILLTMVVQGPSRKRQALETMLDGCERFVSVKVFPFVEGEARPHFAASRPPMEPLRVVPPGANQPAATMPAAKVVPIAAPLAAADGDRAEAAGSNAAPATMAAPEPLPAPAEEPAFEFILPTPRAPAVVPPPVAATPFVEPVPLEPDEAAIERALRDLSSAYPRIVPQLLALAHSVAEGARESSLALAGQRTGAWVFERKYALDVGRDLHEAIEHIGAPALRALVEIDQQGAQLHILNSPLCTKDGHSGCSFFSGFLEGVLSPAVAPGSLSVFPVCCRSYGADECVLAIAE